MDKYTPKYPEKDGEWKDETNISSNLLLLH
jgi:hypothetical protein